MNSIYQHSRELFPIAEHLTEQGWEVHALLGWSGSTADEEADRLVAAGATVHRVPSRFAYGDPRQALPPPPPEMPAIPIRRRTFRSRVGLSLYRLRSFAKLVWSARVTAAYGRNVVAEIDPNLVFGSSYRSIGTFDLAIARAARRRHTLYCCFPYGPHVGERWTVDGRALELRVRSTGLHALRADSSRFRRVLRRIFPMWVREADGTPIFSWRPEAMLAARTAGLVDPNPWQQPSTLYDVCFVESEFSRDLLIESAYGEDKIVVSGKPMLDAVFEHARDDAYIVELYKTLELTPRSPFVLCNVEPLWEHGYLDRNEHFERVERLFAALGRTDLPVVLSLHPISEPGNYDELAERHGFHLSRAFSIAQLHPYCGCIVSFLCSTNPLSLVFDKPLVVYDEFWKFTVGDAATAKRWYQPGAVFVHEIDDVTEPTRRLFQDVPQPLIPDATSTACATIQRVVEERLGV